MIGDVVELVAASGLSLGIGFYNPHSLITFRLLSSHIEEIDFSFMLKRVSQAVTLRKTVYPESECYRLVHSESDFLPGLIIDKYNDYISIQTYSYGMDARLPLICDVIEELLHPKGIVERNESALRALEGLTQKKGVLRGTISNTTIVEHGLRYVVNALEGQKTGFFLDQRENRATIGRFSKGAAVLDCFCNYGGFALNAARSGAASVLGIDSSEEAITNATTNATLNDLKNVRFERADVFERLKQLHTTSERFDLIVLDPPSFTKSKKNVQTARKGYKELHSSAFGLLKKDGVVLSASCSHHITPDVFLEIIADSAVRAGKRLQLLDWRGAGPDHPTLPCMPETRYLKFGAFRLI